MCYSYYSLSLSLRLSAPTLNVYVSEDSETTPTVPEEGVGCHLSLEQAQTLSLQVRQVLRVDNKQPLNGRNLSSGDLISIMIF